MRIISIFTFLLVVSPLIFAQQPRSQHIANYDIQASLDPKTKMILGNETLTWTNTSDDAITELQFHLYMNAFRDKNSTFMKEMAIETYKPERKSRRKKKVEVEKKEDFGSIYISSIKIKNGKSLASSMKFIQPDDENTNDKTVISVQLPTALRPNEKIVLEVSFRTKLPKIKARTGFADENYFLVAQWFPKIGVYEKAGQRYAKKGQWNCHQFHAHSEFYADFGVYNVEINVPKNYTVGATGNLKREVLLKNGTKNLTFNAQDVHDFAWTASTQFTPVTQKWKHVTLTALMQKQHEKQAKRYLSSAILALEAYEKLLGIYPYATLTMIDPPQNGSGSGGMEYPTFITCGYTDSRIPSSIRLAEIVTVHEFGHQYFQGMLASNEFEESWLDEGFNQYIEGRIMDETYKKGSVSTFLGMPINDMESSRIDYVTLTNPRKTPIFRNSWEYPKRMYGVMSYRKTATVLKTLEGLVTKPVMDEILKTYFERWKFKHPSTKNFIEIVNEVVKKRLGNKYGENMDWFFEQTIYNAEVSDFEVSSIMNENGKGKTTIKQLGKMQFPTEILVHFSDGTKQQISWKKEEKIKNLSFNKTIKSVQIDPEKKIYLDLNFINNSKSVEASNLAETKYSLKALFWFQHFLEAFTVII